LWGYVDERGVAHFAPEQRDGRYQLFYKGRSSLDPVPEPAAVPAPADALRDHPLFKRVTQHPNVARFTPLIEQHAKGQGLDVALVKAMIAVESAFDPAAVSPKGAVGLMQVMPATGERYGVAPDRTRTVAQKLADPTLNVRIGTRYLRDLLRRFDHDIVLALAAYNAGEGAVEQFDHQVPPYPETRAYVQLVQQFRDLYEPPVPVRAPAPAPARVTIPLGRPSPQGLPAS
jgi:soluble lytic murein transglycosylase-like protein